MMLQRRPAGILSLAVSTCIRSLVTPVRRPIRHLMLGAILALAGGCGDEQPGEDPGVENAPETTSVEVPDSDGPKVSVTADKTQAVQPGDEITVTVTVEKFTLDAGKIGESNEAGVGHYRVYLDDASGDNFLAESATDTVKVTVPESITDGSHQLRVVLHNNDRTPVSPAVQGDVWLIVYRL